MEVIKRLVKSVARQTGYDIVKYHASGRRLHRWPKPDVVPLSHYDIDDDFHEFYDRLQAKTQMSGTDNHARRHRFYILHYLIENVNFSRGDVCELGCWRGLSGNIIASRIQQSRSGARFHIFDSFQGLSEHKEVDIPVTGIPDKDAARKHFACSEEQVRRNLSDFDFIQYHAGWIPDRFPEVADRKFSFVHVDVDLYEPIRDSIAFFYPRLVTGGVMLFDDYASYQFPGAMKAVDEALAGPMKGNVFMRLPTGQGILVKTESK
jgi:acyl carrier protein phosphodiesterase